MRDSTLVSVLIPCYNSHLYVGECIESALQQTYSNTEIIVVDDGSTDDSRHVIESYGSCIGIEFSPHQGANSARNRLLQLSRGTWVQYLDADNYLLPNKIERQMAIAEENAELDVVYSPPTLVASGGHEHTLEIEQVVDHIANYLLWAPFDTSSMICRAEAIRAVGGWKEDQLCCQEHELLQRLFFSGCQFACLNERIGAMYRRHNGNSVSTKDPENVIRTRMQLTDAMEAYLDKHGLVTELRERCIAQARFENARSMYSFDPKYARELMTKARSVRQKLTGPSAPLRYRIALSVFGFHGAEQLGRVTRELRSFTLSSARNRKPV